MCFGEGENVLVFPNQTIRSKDFQLLVVMSFSHRHPNDHFILSVGMKQTYQIQVVCKDI